MIVLPRLLLLLCLVLIGSAPSSRAASPDPDARLTAFFARLQGGQKETVVTYGTSVTKYGYWVTALQQWFDAQYPGLVTVVNSGGPGRNSDWGLAQVQDMVLDHHPGLVFIEFGTNDAHTRFKLAPEHAKDNLDKIVTAILGQNPQAAIVLQTMNVFWDNPQGFGAGDTDRPQLTAFYDNYRSYGNEHGYPVVDNAPDWQAMKDKDPDKFHATLRDGTHPDKNGNLAVTWPNIQGLLEKAQTAAKAAQTRP